MVISLTPSSFEIHFSTMIFLSPVKQVLHLLLAIIHKKGSWHKEYWPGLEVGLGSGRWLLGGGGAAGGERRYYFKGKGTNILAPLKVTAQKPPNMWAQRIVTVPCENILKFRMLHRKNLYERDF